MISVAIAAMAWSLLLAPGMPAQVTTDAAACWRRVGDLGINGLSASMRMTLREDGTFLRLFYSEPEVLAVEGAADPGLRVGDVLTAVDGFAITTPEAGSRFSDVQPGQRVTFGVRRGGEPRVVTLTAGSRRLPAPPGESWGAGDVRYTGILDRVGIEVRGRPVVVTRDESAGQVTIEADGLVVTLRLLTGQHH